jgi:hypothetical protein
MSIMRGKPNVIPRMWGMVARNPKLTPELATKILLGPGVKAMAARNGKLARIRVTGNGCIIEG